MRLVTSGIKWKSYSPLNIFTCCSSIHKYKSPFLGALLTKTVTRNNSIVLHIPIRLRMSIANILKQKEMNSVIPLRAHTSHDIPPPIARQFWIRYHGNSGCWGRCPHKSVAFIIYDFVFTWNSSNLCLILTKMYNIMTILNNKENRFQYACTSLEWNYIPAHTIWMMCLHEDPVDLEC